MMSGLMADIRVGSEEQATEWHSRLFVPHSPERRSGRKPGGGLR